MPSYKETAVDMSVKVTVATLTKPKGPGISYSKVGTLSKGTTISLVSKSKDANGTTWYKIKGSSQWVSGSSNGKSNFKVLENKISQISTENQINSKADIEEQLRYMTDAKNKAEKEKARLETNIEKMKQLQKEKEQRKTTISDNELKRISSIAKTEQALTLFENNFDIIKNNKTIIKNDTNLRVRVEILSQRLNDFMNSL